MNSILIICVASDPKSAKKDSCPEMNLNQRRCTSMELKKLIRLMDTIYLSIKAISQMTIKLLTMTNLKHYEDRR